MTKQYNKSQKGDTLDKRNHDLYETPWQATRALINNINLGSLIYEPCYGRGAIVDELNRSLHKIRLKIITSDIICHDNNNPPNVVKDFLQIKPSDFPKCQLGVYSIVTNPPFKNLLPQKFILHGLSLAPRVYMLLRLAFLEGSSKERCEALSHCRRVLVFKNRIPRMHRDGWAGSKASSTVAYGWFEFDRNIHSSIEIERIEWDKSWVK